MPDYDQRNHQFRGGGGNARKRRYTEDDDYDRRPQRRRYEEPAYVKLRKRLLDLADSTTRKPEEEISDISRLLQSNAEDDELRRVFLALILQLSLEQPLKIPFLAALILTLHYRGSNLVPDTVKSCGEALERYIVEGSWRESKLLLRLFACMQPLWKDDGIFPLLEKLFSRAVDLQTASSEDGLGLELVKIILLTMAYAMAAQAPGFEEQASALLEKTDIVASTPHVLEPLSNPKLANSEAAPSKSVLGQLQLQMQAESEAGWPLKCIPRLSQAEAASGSLAIPDKLALPIIDIPSDVTSSVQPILPEIYYSIYREADVETVPREDNIASSLVRDTIIDTINILHFNRNAAAKSLIDIDCYFAQGIFITRGTPFDKLRTTAGDGSIWKTEDVAVDAVFSQLLKLPAPEHKLVYYHSILAEVCKLAPAAIAPSLGRAIRFLYREVDQLDLELVGRFIDWFSHHLSNFGFTWKWTEWVDDVELPPTHPRKAFIVGALEKEIRLSFAQRIRGTLPEPYHPLVGTEKEKDTPDFKYSDPAHPHSTEAREIVRLLRAKASDAEIEDQLNKIQDAALEVEGGEPLQQSTDALITALCFVGSKSLSHVLSCIDRCKDRLMTIGSTSDVARQQIITSVLLYWVNKPGTAINIIDKLLNYSILNPRSVVEWVFTYRLNKGHILAEPHVYEMVSQTLHKVAIRLRQLITARLQHDLVAEQVNMLEQSIAKESAQMKLLFSIVEDATRGLAEGSADALMETEEQSEEQLIALRQWGQRWLRVFTRKFAIEEAWSRESLAASQQNVEGGENGSAPLQAQSMDTETT